MIVTGETCKEQALSAFHSQFGTQPSLIAQAPGRVNLIGEHTDYNDGYVLPMAIDRQVCIAAQPRLDRRIVLYAVDFDDEIVFSLDSIQKGTPGPSEYVKGVCYYFQEQFGMLHGFEGVLKGNVPIGAGLSSSAALELATLRILAVVSNINWDPVQMAILAQRAENQWVGINCGIMDQLIVATGRAGHAMLIDCRSLEIQPTPLPSSTAIVVMDTNTRRGKLGLIDSAYNERREQCEAAANVLGVTALRDVSNRQLRTHKGLLNPLTYRRARHVVTENARTLKASKAMHADDAHQLGLVMNESHASLRDDFEVSTAALDVISEIARSQPGCYGARMTGGGFGGCAVALVDRPQADLFNQNVSEQYHKETGIEPQLTICRASEGATLLDF